MPMPYCGRSFNAAELHEQLEVANRVMVRIVIYSESLGIVEEMFGRDFV